MTGKQLARDWLAAHCNPAGGESVKLNRDTAEAVFTVLSVYLHDLDGTIERFTQLWRDTRSPRIAAQLRYYKHARSYMRHAVARTLYRFNSDILAQAAEAAASTLEGYGDVATVPTAELGELCRTTDNVGSGPKRRANRPAKAV